MQHGQSGEGREVVDVKCEEPVAYLRQKRVVKLKERELVTVAVLPDFFHLSFSVPRENRRSSPRLASTWSARRTIEGGIPASFATCMPKLWADPPLSSLRMNTTFPRISRTDTLKLTIL